MRREVFEMGKTCRDCLKNVATDKKLLRQVKKWQYSVKKEKFSH